MRKLLDESGFFCYYDIDKLFWRRVRAYTAFSVGGVSMSLEAITTISEAEENARRMKAEAAAAAKAAEAVALAEGKAALEAAAQKAASELAELRAKSDEKAREDARQLASDTENKKAAMRARADARLGKAAALIVERVVNG